MAENNRHSEAVQAALIADELGLGRSLEMWSMLFAVLSGAGMFMAAYGNDKRGLMAFGAVLLIAVGQKYFALRTQLDAAIFQRWAENWRLPAGSTPTEDMAALDKALGQEASAFRSLADRAGGARKLLVRQFICFIIQSLCFLVGIWLLTSA